MKGKEDSEALWTHLIYFPLSEPAVLFIFQRNDATQLNFTAGEVGF